MKPPMPRRTIPSTPRKKESIITPAIAPNDPNGSDWKLPKARNTGSTDPTKRASPTTRRTAPTVVSWRPWRPNNVLRGGTDVGDAFTIGHETRAAEERFVGRRETPS